MRSSSLKSKMKAVAGTIVNNIGLPDAYTYVKRKFAGSQAVIVTYHRVCPTKAEWSISAQNPLLFERQIKHLCEHYEILSLERLASLVRERNLPKITATITFDDGYRDNYHYAYPALKKYHVPATIFLTTGHIGTGNPFWWDKVRYAIHNCTAAQLELHEAGNYTLKSSADRRVAASLIIEKLWNLADHRKNQLIAGLLDSTGVEMPEELSEGLLLSWEEVAEMGAHGIDFGAHTINHPNLTKVPLAEARKEIVRSKKDIEKMTGRKTDFFSYPGGMFNDKIVKIVARSDFVGAVVSNQKWINPETGPYKLSRVGATEDFNLFKINLSGLYGDLVNRNR